MSRFLRYIWTLLFRRDDTEIKVYNEDDFKVLKFLSKGAFSCVYLCELKASKELLAMKVTDIDDNSHQTNMETQIMFQIKHPFVMSAKYSFQSLEQHFLIMPYALGGDLSFYLKDESFFDEETSRFYAGEIASAIAYLHSVNIVHRDIKLENIMMTETGHVKLTDFGVSLANVQYGSLLRGFHGTPLYAAPEIFSETGYERSIDWFAFGILLYRMMIGVMPFLQAKLIPTATVKFKSGQISAVAKNLITRFLDRSPLSRLGSGRNFFKEIKTHPFFKTLDFKKLHQLKPPLVPEVSSDRDTRYFPRSAVV